MVDAAAARRAGRRLRRGIAALACLVPALSSGQVITDIDIDTPRDFGYTIGDTIRHELRLSLGESHRLDTATLPKTGRLNRWLEISRVDSVAKLDGRNAVHRVIVDYQIFNAPQQVTPVTIPPLEFLTTGGANRVQVALPEWTFRLGPVTDPEARQAMQLRPDREPQPIPVAARQARLSVWLLALVGLLAYVVYARFLLPRLRRDQYPFAAALESLRRLQRAQPGPEDYRRGLRAFHAAVNATAGHAVFATDLDAFVAANAKYAAVKSELVDVYEDSRAVFFRAADVATPERSLRSLVDLCRQCRALERSAA